MLFTRRQCQKIQCALPSMYGTPCIPRLYMHQHRLDVSLPPSTHRLVPTHPLVPKKKGRFDIIAFDPSTVLIPPQIRYAPDAAGLPAVGAVVGDGTPIHFASSSDFHRCRMPHFCKAKLPRPLSKKVVEERYDPE